MTMKKVPKEIIFFFEKSNEPWGIKDKESRYVYANKAYFDFLGVPMEKRNKIHFKSYDFIPSLKPLIEGLVSHDQEVMNTGVRYEAVGTLLINGQYRTFLFEKWPRYSKSGEINGTIFHLKPFELISMSYFIDKPFYGKATYSPPTEIFSPREWDVLFLLFRRIEKRQISKILKLRETSVRNLISRLFLRTGTSGREELLNYGFREGWHLYIPPRFAEIGYDLISDKTAK
ncbi:PAS domain-containing protein [Yersinia pestis]|nr:hypothetical protein [Salmonella enterica]ECH4042263.1 hypothetical protein [Salmonella enterica]MDL0457408.1 PAS domain-containing protein [Yersinia pestis]MDL1129141.1 PAS domain-containing protein [Yersinia pestis]